MPFFAYSKTSSSLLLYFIDTCESIKFIQFSQKHMHKKKVGNEKLNKKIGVGVPRQFPNNAK